MRIRRGDQVEVITGNDQGKRGKVLQVLRNEDKIVVEGINQVYKHVRRGHPKSPQGGRLHVEMPIAASNVMLVCPKTNETTRIGVRILDDGSKERYAKKSGASMGVVAPPKTKTAPAT